MLPRDRPRTLRPFRVRSRIIRLRLVLLTALAVAGLPATPAQASQAASGALLVSPSRMEVAQLKLLSPY